MLSGAIAKKWGSHQRKMRLYKNKKASLSKVLLPLVIIVIIIILSATAYAQVTYFNNSFSILSVSFPQNRITHNFFVSVPNGTVAEARMRIQGFDILGQNINPADVILVTDTSGSMDTNLPTGGTKMSAAKAADISFLNNVNFNYVHVGLVHYHDNASTQLDLHLTDNINLLTSTINAYSASGWTAMGKGMQLAINELLNAATTQPDAKKYMVLMTDGWTNCNATGSSPSQICGNQRNVTARAYVRAMANLAAANNIVIYGIAFGACGNVYTSTQNTADCNLINEISALTGGKGYNTSNAQTLTEIYNLIARTISEQNFTTPIINSTSPMSMRGWAYSVPFSGNLVWNGANCGGDSRASCTDFRSLIQSNLAQCLAYPCDIQFSAYSSTVGMLNLSELYIRLNEPPIGNNEPPLGSCRAENITCGQTNRLVNVDDGSMVTDPNDALNTLSWVYDSFIESAGGAYFSLNNDFNTKRKLNISIDPAHSTDSFWKTYYFNITDPWGESTNACINVSYTGCVVVNPVLNVSNRTITFDISSQPGYHYNLRNMVDNITNIPCTIDQLDYRFLSDYNNFIIWGPDAQGNITIIPNNPEDWFTPTSESIQVEAFCPGGGTRDGRTYTRRGKADVVLITDFSGSMKKAVDSWIQGTGITNCQQLYGYADARKSHLAVCLDKNLTQTVMSYENNRIWPIFIHDDQVKAYTGDPSDTAAIIGYIDTAVPQGKEKTCLACAVNKGYDILNQFSLPERNKFIILMTDGVPTHCAQGSCTSTSSVYGNFVCNGFCDTNGQSGCGDEEVQGCTDPYCQAAEGNTLFSMSKAVDDLDVIFYTIAFGLVEDCSQADMLLGTIASVSGGEYHHSSDVDELRRIYNDIAQKITQISENITDPPYQFNISDTATLTINYVAPSPTCGNGVRDNPAEECDLGVNNNNLGTCSEICTRTYCGDNWLQQPNGRGTLGPLGNGVEQCDDGDIYIEDGCTPQCVAEWCGDHDLQPGLGEQCDDGDSNDNGDGCVGCLLQVAPECGNVIIEVGEGCDDGNLINGDGCDEYCQVEGAVGCGNAIIEDGEGCDDGNDNPNDGCDQCHLIPAPSCNNSVIEENEECDDGNNINGDGCSDICRLEGAPGCGNGVKEQGEQCDDGCLAGNPYICDPADNGDGCEMNCTLTPYPVLSVSDTTISFDYSAYPGYNYTLDDMLSLYAILPCDESTLYFNITRSNNFSITTPINPDGNITIVPNHPDWLNATSEKLRVDVYCPGYPGTNHDAANLTIIYTAVGAPSGRIKCEPTTPSYMLSEGETRSIPLDNIFEFSGVWGTPNELIIASPSSDVSITSSLPNGINAQSNGFVGERTVRIIIKTNIGIASDSCPIDFFDLGSKCNKQECDECVNSGDFDCFVIKECLDKTVLVLNPYTPVKVASLIDYAIPLDFTVNSFAPLPPPEPRFIIEPPSGSMNQIFKVNGSLVGHGNVSAAIAKLSFSGYEARICPMLVRLNYNIGEESYDPVTDLLITGSKAVIGYYELLGGVESKGPYIFTAKVWLRE
jgi:cysteine-rich repeat protein